MNHIYREEGSQPSKISVFIYLSRQKRKASQAKVIDNDK